MTRMEQRPQSPAMRHLERKLPTPMAVLDSRESSLYKPRAPSSAVARARRPGSSVGRALH